MPTRADCTSIGRRTRSLVHVTAAPLGNYEVQIQRDVGIFAQDQWTIDRLTLNLGARYDWFRGGLPAVTGPGGRLGAGA